MSDTEAEKKEIARLDFNIELASKKLQSLNNELKKISEESENYSEKISKNLNSLGNNKLEIDTSAFKNSTDKILKIDDYVVKERLDNDKVLQRKLIENQDKLNKNKEKIDYQYLKKKEYYDEKMLNSSKTIFQRMSNYAETYLIYQGFNKLKQAIPQIIDEMVKLESEMVQIDRVLNESNLNITEYRDKLIQLAYDYANSIDNVTDVTLRLAQAGYDSEEALALTEKTLLALNTAELDATQATDDMVAVMAQWGLRTGTATEQAEQYGEIIDKINKVADRYPTTSADIMDALKKVSTGFNLAGASIDQTIATITAAEIASQRGGKVIGTALSNISQQIKNVDVEELGISFFTDENKNEYKDLITIFQELANKMEELKKEGKENSVEMQNLLSVFTVFRRNIGASLLGEMGGELNSFESIMQDIGTAVGYSAEENTKYMKTMAAAQEQFNNKLLQLKTEVWDNKIENIYRDLLKTGGGLIEWITKLSKSAMAIPSVIGLVTASFSLLGKKIDYASLKKYTMQIGDLKAAFNLYNKTVASGQKVGEDFYKLIENDVPKGTTKYLKSLNNGSAGLVDFAAKTVGAKVAQLGLNLAIAAGEAALSFGLSFAIQGIISLIGNLIITTKEAAESMEEANNKLNDNQTSLNNYVDKFSELREEMLNGNLTQEEFNKNKTELKGIEEELIKLYGDEAKSLNLVSGEIDEQINKIKELGKQDYIKYLQENYKSIQKTIDSVTKESFKDTALGKRKNLFLNYSDYETYRNKLIPILKEIKNLQTDTLNDGTLYITAKGTSEEMISAYREAFNKIKEYSTETTGEEQEFLNKSLENISNSISSLENKYGDSIEVYKDFLTKRLEYDEQYSEDYAKILAARSELEEAIESKDTKKIKIAKENINTIYEEAINQASKDTVVSDGMINLLKEQLDVVNEEIEKEEIGLKIGIKGDDLFDSIQATLDKMGDISLEDLKLAFDIDDITDNMKELKDILDENGISVEQLTTFFEYLGFQLGETNATIEETTDSIQNQKDIVETTFADLDILIDKYGQVTEAVNEYNAAGNLTYDTLSSLINNDLLQYLDLTSDKLSINEAAFTNAASAAKANAMYQLAAEAATQIASIAYGEQSNQINAAKASTEGMTTKTQGIYNELIKAIPKILEGADAWNSYNEAMTNIDTSGLSDDATDKINNVVRNLATMTTSLNNIKVTSVSYSRVSARSSGGSGGSGSSGRTSGSNSSTYDTEKAAEEARKAEEEKYKKNLEIFKDYVSEKERLEQRWVKKEKELEQLSDKDYLYIIQQRIKRYEEYIDQVNKMTWLSEEDRLDLITEYTEKIEDLQVDYFDYLKDQLEDEIDKLEKANKEKIQLIEDEADARINALKKVKDETSRIRDEEDYDAKRQEILEQISYWEQRTGREAAESLKESKKSLAELDEEWRQQLEDWSIDDQIQAIEDERDAQIQAIEDSQAAEIASMQAMYDEKVRLYVETGQIIYDESIIQSNNLYNAYKDNFVNPILADLQSIQDKINQQTVQTATETAAPQYETYTIKSGDTLSGIAKKYNTTVDKLMEANPYITNKNLIYAGKTLQIPKFHEGGIFGGNYEGYALLKPGEAILTPEWTEQMNRFAKYVSNITNLQGQPIGSGNKIEVNGNLVNVQADIKNETDMNNLTRKIEKMLKDKFNIKK